jgi:hypothetical protein
MIKKCVSNAALHACMHVANGLDGKLNQTIYVEFK